MNGTVHPDPGNIFMRGGVPFLSYLKQTLKRKDKARDSDWDFGARQSDAPIRRDSFATARRRRSTSLDRQRCPPPIQRAEVPQHQVRNFTIVKHTPISPS